MHPPVAADAPDATTGAAIAAGTYSNTIIVQDTTTTDTLASLTVNGNAAVVLDVTGSTALRTIDASANTGGVSVTAASTLSATLHGAASWTPFDLAPLGRSRDRVVNYTRGMALKLDLV